MFVYNKYYFTYFNIINAAKSRLPDAEVYYEKHHITPKSLGGSNDSTNLVKLTGREHFVCHLLLVRFTTGVARKKCCTQFGKCAMQKNQTESYKLTAKKYESIKLAMRNSRTSADFTDEWKTKISAAKRGKEPWNRGIARSEDTKLKISVTRRANRDNPNWNTRPACKPETAEKIKQANTGKQWVHDSLGNRKYLSTNDAEILLALGWTPGIGEVNQNNQECPHCGKVTGNSNFVRWHGDKCRQK